MKKLYLLLLLLTINSAWSQHQIPISVGGQIELSSSYMQPSKPDGGLGRVSPFIALYLESLGIIKIAFSGDKFMANDSVGNDISSTFTAWTMQIGGSLGGSGRPYLYTSYTKIKIFSSYGDNDWNEFGFGLGGTWNVSSWMSLITEVEYRIQQPHTIDYADIDVEENHRVQFNFGTMFFFF